MTVASLLPNPHLSASSNSPRKSHRAWERLAGVVERAMLVNTLNPELLPLRVDAIYLVDGMNDPHQARYHHAQLVLITSPVEGAAQQIHDQLRQVARLSGNAQEENMRRLARFVRGGDAFFSFVSAEKATLMAAHDAKRKSTLLASRSDYINRLVQDPDTSSVSPAERELFARTLAAGFTQPGKIDLTAAFDERMRGVKQKLAQGRKGWGEKPQVEVLKKALLLLKAKTRLKLPKNGKASSKDVAGLQSAQDALVLGMAAGHPGMGLLMDLWGDATVQALTRELFPVKTPAMEAACRPQGPDMQKLVEAFRQRQQQAALSTPSTSPRPA